MRNRKRLLTLLQLLQPFTQSGSLTGVEASLITTSWQKGDSSLLVGFVKRETNNADEWLMPSVENLRRFLMEENNE